VKVAYLIAGGLAAGSSAAAIAQLIQPGQWEMTTTATSIGMPGAPPEIAAMMKGRPIKLNYCITPEEAKLGPRSLTKANKDCHYTRFDVRGNRIESQLVCTTPRGTTTATSSGSFTPTSFVSDGRTVTTGQRPMTVTAHAVARRIGNCTK
jgi:hypothetical protein